MVEVIVGVALTGLLVLGLSAMWAFVAENFQNLDLRQRAVFALSNETERLNAYFSGVGDNATYIEGVTYDADDPLASGTQDRQIYLDAAGDFVVTDTGDFDDGDPDTIADLTAIYVREGGSQQGNRNLVWLDQQRRIIGLLSWRWADIGDTSAIQAIVHDYPTYSDHAVLQLEGGGEECATVSACKFVEVIVDFPYRFEAATEALTLIPPSSNVSIQTIMVVRN